MIYKGIYQKQPEMVKFMILLFVSFIVSAIIERLIGLEEMNHGIWLYFLFSSLIKIAVFFLLGFIYYELMNKKKEVEE